MVAVLYCFLNGEVGTPPHCDVNIVCIDTLFKPQDFHAEIAHSAVVILRKCSLSVVFFPATPSVHHLHSHTHSWKVDGAVSVSHQRWWLQPSLLPWTSSRHIFCLQGGRAVKKAQPFWQGAIQWCLQRLSVGTLVMFPALSQIESQWWVGWPGLTLCCLNFNLLPVSGVPLLSVKPWFLNDCSFKNSLRPWNCVHCLSY